MADMKNRPLNDVVPQRRSTGETPAMAPRPLPAPPAPELEAPPRRLVAKGDGMTSDKPALPSEQRPDVAGKRARSPAPPETPPTIEVRSDVPAQQISEAVKNAASGPNAAAMQRRKGGYNKGDGMTAPKPRLQEGLPPPSPVALPAQEGTLSVGELLRRNSNPSMPASGTDDKRAARDQELKKKHLQEELERKKKDHKLHAPPWKPKEPVEGPVLRGSWEDPNYDRLPDRPQPVKSEDPPLRGSWEDPDYDRLPDQAPMEPMVPAPAVPLEPAKPAKRGGGGGGSDEEKDDEPAGRKEAEAAVLNMIKRSGQFDPS
ncbi:MAG TPA: hypothetical protein VND93_29510 [Myxococcales bacterium]|nr:hypothetical protein [Myxococcales bacterium]